MNRFVPDSTAVRVALWRAMHVQLDAAPHVLNDELGLMLVNPDESWKQRPDMHPQGTAPFRASIVARSRFVEDLVKEASDKGVTQYVLLGAGLDTFAERQPELASKIRIFEIDKPDTLAWKEQRLKELGIKIPSTLTFVPVNFETKESWWPKLQQSGFDSMKPAIVASLGVSMYLTRDAITETLRQMSRLVPGSTFIMTFMLPLDQVAQEDRIGYERSIKGAQASGTPFLSFFLPEEMMKLAREVGFKSLKHTSTSHMIETYFSGRSDGLRPSTGEEFLIAMT